MRIPRAVSGYFISDDCFSLSTRRLRGVLTEPRTSPQSWEGPVLDTSVVVVDDDEDIRDLVVFKMRQLGYRVTSCADGMAALEECRTNRPDVIVLDLMMPGLSGLDVCRELRRDEDLARIPVVMLTARARDSDIEQGFSAGADDYIVKPFSPRELGSRVQAVLERSRG